jgi:hypothetical protein
MGRKPKDQTAVIYPGMSCIQWDADWTAVDALIVESLDSAKIILMSLQRNGKYSGGKLTLPRSVPLFENPYPRLAAPENEQTRRRRNEAVRVRSAAIHWISNAQGRPKLIQLLAHLETQFGREQMPFVRGCLKCSVSVGSITVRGEGGSDPDHLIVNASKSSRDIERTATYAASFADELEAQAKRVGLLITHWPTVGTFREELLRNVLQKNLPERYHVATGFLFGYPRQLDIIIYDRIDHAPLFREGNLVVVHVSAIRAVIEVKSTLNHEELRSALDVLHPIEALTGPPIFKGVFAYTSKMSTTAILDTMVDFYKLNNDDVQSDAALMSFTEIITAVCVQNQTLIISQFDEHGDMMVPALFSVENRLGRSSQVAIFFDALRLHTRGTGPATGLELGGFLEGELDQGEKRSVYEEIWGPYFLDDCDRAQLRAEAQAIERWQRGASW